MSILLAMATNGFAAAKFVTGLVPDWNQPYRYVAPNGPGPDPAPFAPNQWNDWCAPSSGANLAGYWTDGRGVPVGDTTNYPYSSAAWASGPSWQDYLADGTLNRPLFPAGALPAQTTDIGWYMNANYGIAYDAGGGKVMGGYPFGNPQHRGTYLKDIHAGLQLFLNGRYSLGGGIYWKTGTRGSGFAAGTDPTGAAAVIHPNAASAFGEVTSEIDTNRTLIVCFRHWNLVAAAVPPLASVGPSTTESYYAGSYYTWGSTPTPPYTNAEDEVWTNLDNGLALGHAVTVVGYIRAGDADDKGPVLGLGPTDWVIVHDNWSSTPRNVIVPYTFQGGFVATWVANTTAKPWPTAAKFVKGVVPDWNQPYHYTVQSPRGGPGPDPNWAGQPFKPADQWNDWCAPTSAANLVGHWADHHCTPVADTTPFDGSTLAWGAGPSWQDYLADGFARPAPQAPPGGPLPVPATDIGWYMDSNLGVVYDPPAVGVMGGFFYANGPHVGTFLKDIAPGLQSYLISRYLVIGGAWDTGTEGKGYAAGMNPNGSPAQMLLDPVSAFNGVTTEINRDHTLILCFKHWNIAAAATASLTATGTNTESDFGGSYYQWGLPPGPTDTNGEDEVWNLYEGSQGLGHAVTAVGYIPAGDVLDPGPSLAGLLVPTDWVVVHDNWFTTPRNVIIPLDFANNWVANTYAFPDPGFLQLTNITVINKTNAVVSLTGLPGCRHDLLANTNLLITNGWWTAVSNVPFAAGSMRITNSVPGGDPQRFYRIRAGY
ncbi:MAG TPA: hypothetical protein VMB80_10255 [Candidatus Acidoferrum sp.]|nr:hypothetical protein [Candidatus Acidoferrum sp.]